MTKTQKKSKPWVSLSVFLIELNADEPQMHPELCHCEPMIRNCTNLLIKHKADKYYKHLTILTFFNDCVSI